MHLAHYLELLHRAEADLAAAFRAVAQAHQAEIDVYYIGSKLARQSDAQVTAVRPFLEEYQRSEPDEPERAPSARFRGPRGSGVGLLRDLQDLYLMVAECDACWIMVDQAAQGARDTDLLAVARRRHGETGKQLAWLRTQLAQAAVQALVVA